MDSHEFIRFPPYEVKLTPSLLMLLGEIQAELNQIAKIPISPQEQHRLKILYFARAVHSTTAIEGNTLSEDEVLRIIRDQDPSSPSSNYDEQEVRNVIDALNLIDQDILDGNSASYSLALLNGFHRQLISATGTPNCSDTEIGELRKQSVTVGRYLGPPAAECRDLLAKFCEWLNEDTSIPEGLERYELTWQIVRAIVAHIYFAWIHPYCDGNGRMARLIEFRLAFAAGVPDFAAHLFSNVYNRRRTKYVELLQDSHGDFLDGAYSQYADIQRFVEWALECYRHDLHEQSLYIYSSQITVIWHDYIYSSFPEKLSNAQRRRRRLALDLTHPEFQQPVQFRDIRNLSPAVAVAYVDESDQTIRNDLRVLIDMGLVQRAAGGYKPNTDILTGFFASVRAQED
ncbi:MAG: Fic family protein [Chloroflexi bacterium]|nr:Fic family protein [Chloroflexota bacterium]